MPIKIKKIFEKEYESKGRSKKEADKIFYKWLNKHKMNKKGNIAMTAIIALAFFMFGILIIGLLFPDISITRDSNNLDCSNQSISSGNKIACLGVDAVVPAWIISLVLIGGGAVIYKLVA
jgi:hypothetical protein